MRINGLIFFRLHIASSDNGGNLNEYGEVAPISEEWSDGFPCSISTNNDNRRGKYVDGQFRQCSFTILLEDSLNCCDSISRVRLQRGCDNLGEFQVQSAERLSSVGRIKIIV